MSTSFLAPFLHHPLIIEFTSGKPRLDVLAYVLASIVVLYITFYQISVSTFTTALNLPIDLETLLKGKSSKSFPLPPGPPSWPIFGYLSGLPKIRAWEVYNEWSKTYGSDVLHVPTFMRHIIILNSAEAVFELLEQRGGIYSDRPRMVMLHDLMDLGQTTAFARYGTNWRQHRKIYNQQMNINSVKRFRNYQSAAARNLVSILLESPEAFVKHCRHFSAGVVMDIAYGYEIVRENDELVQLTETTGRSFSEAAQPGYYMVDNFPFLRHVPSFLPFTYFKTIAVQTRERAYQTRTVPFRRVVQGMKIGSFKKCFVSDLLGDLENIESANFEARQQAGVPAKVLNYASNKRVSENFSYENLKGDKDMEEFEKREDVGLIKAIAGGIFGAGTTTTTSALQTFILAMIIYPTVQQKAQDELDRVLELDSNEGSIGERLPTFEDRPSLPYITALCQEVLRWFPVTPAALPHVTTEEDIYKGYRIPKGSILIPNAWNILHDPRVYPNPDEFKPERFLPDESGKILARDPAVNGAFGFGRRICAGRNLAEASIWIAVASILTVFNIRPALDENGKPVDVTGALKGTPGLFNHPLPFKCRIEPRSETMKKNIFEARAAAALEKS